MTSDAIENDTIELAVLKNPDIDTEIVSLALQSHFRQGLKVNRSDSSYKPRAWEVQVLL